MQNFNFFHALAHMPTAAFWLALAIFLFMVRKHSHTLLLMGIMAVCLSLPSILAVLSKMLEAPSAFDFLYVLENVLVLPATLIFLVLFTWLVDTKIVNASSNTTQSVNFLFKALALNVIVFLFFVLSVVTYFTTVLPQFVVENINYDPSWLFIRCVAVVALSGIVVNMVSVIAIWSFFAETRNLKTFYKHCVLLMIPVVGVIWYLVMFKQFERKLISLNGLNKGTDNHSDNDSNNDASSIILLIQRTRKVFIFALLTFVGMGWSSFIAYIEADDIIRLISGLFFLLVSIAFLVFWLKFFFALRKADQEVNGNMA